MNVMLRSSMLAAYQELDVQLQMAVKRNAFLAEPVIISDNIPSAECLQKNSSS